MHICKQTEEQKTINNAIIINLIKGYVICISPDHIITFQLLALFIVNTSLVSRVFPLAKWERPFCPGKTLGTITYSVLGMRLNRHVWF